MIDDEDAYFQNSADSLALFTLFDAVSDYCLTQKFWEQIGKLCPDDLIHKLQNRRVNDG